MPARTALVLLLASTLTALAGSIVAPALPVIAARFEDTPGAVTLTRLILTLPGLGVVLSAGRLGRLADLWGRRRLMIAGMILFAVTGTSGVWLDDLYAILAGRILLGVAIAAIMISVTALIAELTSGKIRSRFMGHQLAAMSIGGLLFMTGGGVLSDLGWRWPFAVYGVSVLLIPAVLRTIAPDRPRPDAPREEAPLTPTLLTIYVAAFLGMALFYITPLQLPFLLRDVFGADGTRTGLSLGLITISITAGSLIFSRLRSRLGSRRLFVLTFATMAPGMTLIGVAPSWAVLLAGFVVLGVASGQLMPNQSTWISELVPDAQRGRALGRLTTAIFMGQFLSLLLSEPAERAGVSLAGVFLLGAVLSGLVAVGLWLRFKRIGPGTDGR